MESSIHCLPCFLQQTIKAAGLSTGDTALQKRIVDEIARLLPTLDLSKTPPENSVAVYETIAAMSGCRDPFAELKEQSNRFALGLTTEVKKAIADSDDSLATALHFSIAGNIIDYGSQQDFDADSALRQCLQTPLAINDYEFLRRDLARSRLLLYLGDNAGEIVFDSLVVDQIKQLFPELDIVYVVKERPIINDALLADADQCGLPKKCRVISNGTGCPGTPLASSSDTLLKLFRQADLIISKGQGNFETLSEIEAPLYFLLTLKCPIVAEHLTAQSGMTTSKGELVLMRAGRNTMINRDSAPSPL